MKILLAAVVSESILATLALVVIKLFDLPINWRISPFSITWGVLAALPLLGLNYYLWNLSLKNQLSIYAKFSREIIIPLCRAITLKTTIIIAILSGLCEELFFRGALNALSTQYLGLLASCLVTSATFAGVHFIGSFKRFGAMIPLYTAVGVYFWLVHRISDSLATVAVAHGIYNFVVILAIKKINNMGNV